MEKLSTKEEILKVAQKMFGRKGYSATSMTDIATEVGIKKSSLYYFFQNKQQIYLTIIDSILSNIKEAYSVDPTSNPKKNPLKVLEDIMSRTLDVGIKNGALIGVKDETLLNESSEDLLSTMRLAHEVQTTIGMFLKKAGSSSPSIATQILMDSMQGYICRVHERQKPVDKKKFIKYLSERLLK